MGKIGTKGKKPSVTNQDNRAMSEKASIPSNKRRGRPQKLLKDEIDEDQVPKMEDEDNEDANAVVPNKDAKITNGKKRKNDIAQVEEEIDAAAEEGNGNVTKSSNEESKNLNGLRRGRNRRKNEPRRAAEAGVECS